MSSTNVLYNRFFHNFFSEVPLLYYVTRSIFIQFPGKCKLIFSITRTEKMMSVIVYLKFFPVKICLVTFETLEKLSQALILYMVEENVLERT